MITLNSTPYAGLNGLPVLEWAPRLGPIRPYLDAHRGQRFGAIHLDDEDGGSDFIDRTLKQIEQCSEVFDETPIVVYSACPESYTVERNYWASRDEEYTGPAITDKPTWTKENKKIVAKWKSFAPIYEATRIIPARLYVPDDHKESQISFKYAARGVLFNSASQKKTGMTVCAIVCGLTAGNNPRQPTDPEVEAITGELSAFMPHYVMNWMSPIKGGLDAAERMAAVLRMFE